VTAESCRAAQTPQPAIFGAPASQTFSGPGNPPLPTPPKPVVLTNAQKLAKALKACRKDKHKPKRVACERQARKRYPVAGKTADSSKAVPRLAAKAPVQGTPASTGVAPALAGASSRVVGGEPARVSGVRPAVSGGEALVPWWGLSVSERPTDLRAGVGKDERQQVTVTATGGEFFLADALELFQSGFTKGFALFKWDATAGELQAGLEGVFGTGNVRVLKGQGNATGSEPYEIEFTGTLGSQQVSLLAGAGEVTGLGGTTNLELSGGEGSVSVTELAKGTADGQVVFSAVNLGDAEATGTITVAGKLPAGLRAVGIEAIEGPKKSQARAEPVCVLSTLSCTYEAGLPAFETIEVYVSVVVEAGAASGELVSASVSGGGAAPRTETHKIEVDSGERFGIEDYRLTPENVGGSIDTQAGSHPFQVTGVYTANTKTPFIEELTGEELPQTVALPKDIMGELPAGFVGNPTPFAQCTDAQFATEPKPAHSGELVAYNECPAASAIGVAVVTYTGTGAVGFETASAPIFNMTPLPGEPARFAFKPAGLIPVFMNTSVRTGSDYGVDFSFHDVVQSAWVLSTRLTFWGVPGDPRHDRQRGWDCLKELGPCPVSSGFTPPPFLVMPTSCEAPFTSTLRADSWSSAGHPSEETGLYSYTLPEKVDGCTHLPFDPSIITTPDVPDGSSATGLTTDVHVPQRAALAPEGLAESSVRDIEVALPEGVVVNPSGADGLQACTESEVGFAGENQGTDEFTDGLPEPFCPDAAKIGTVKIKTPLLPNPLEGAAYLASQNENPFGSLVALYIVAQDPVSGTLVKLAGEVQLGAGGQLLTKIKNSPELPFEDAELHFFGGERSPLATPARCGSYTTTAAFTPWSGNPPVGSSSTFNITTGPDGSPCPGAALPFAPKLAAGTTSVQAGAFSPLVTTMNRKDGEQPLQSIQIHTPGGLSGLLSGVKLCGEPQADEGTCGPESLIGETTVSVGVGGDPFSVTGGKVYITGPYQGAPFGLSVVNPAKAGPYDLEKGTPCDCVVVRARIEVDPHTAALTVTTDSTGPYKIPTIIDGIPLQIQHVNVTINRPSFTFNPTNCNPMAITALISSTEGATTPLEVPFQATNCKALAFAPKFTASTSAHTSKQDGASLTVNVTYPKAPFGTQTNIAQTKVELPKQLPSRLTTLQKACLAKVFDTNPASCPPGSIVGHAKATTPLIPVPLEGPAYFVSNGGEQFPNLIIVLQGYGVTIDLVGDTFISKTGVTSSTFKTIPDAPVNTFQLTLPEGPDSALAANTNLCTHQTLLKMPTTITSQANTQTKQNTQITITGCTKPKPKPKHHTKTKHTHHKH
jgi:hypothetical protein